MCGFMALYKFDFNFNFNLTSYQPAPGCLTVPVKFHLESICLAVSPQSTNVSVEALSVTVVVFLRSACYNNVLSLRQTDGHRYHDSYYLNHFRWMENCTKAKFVHLILSKII